MANFEPIVEWLLWIEDDKRTPGKIENLDDGAGVTRLGITSKNFGSVMPVNFFSTMPFKQAVQAAKWFYQNQEWHHLNGDQIQDDSVAAALLSFAVNKSVPTAVKTLQAILGVDVDGVLGLGTLTVLNSKDPKSTLALFRSGWIGYYRHVVAVNPDDERFLQGWINRANTPYPNSQVPNIYV